MHDPKTEACKVLLPRQGSAQERRPEGELLHKTYSFRIPILPSSRGFKTSDIYIDLMNPHSAPLRQEVNFSNIGDVRVLHF